MANVNMIVLGGPGSGKTTLAAWLDRQITQEQQVCKGLAIRRAAEKVRPAQYSEALACTEQYFSSQNPEMFRETGNGVPMYIKTEYSPELNGKTLGFNMSLVDPGAYDFERVDHINQVYDLVKNSQMILITIDTPRLMEEMDHYSDEDTDYKKYNRIREITLIVLQALRNSRDRRLVLFVPMKCEHYYHDDRMKEVNRAVKDAYCELFEFLDDEGIASVTVPAIVPVMTLGGAVFDHFDEAGKACYRKTEMGYQPTYAEHVLLLCQQYLLCQVQHYRKNPKEAKLRFGKTVDCRCSADALMKAKADIGSYLDGHDSIAFEILRDPLGLNIRRRLADFNILMFGSRRAGKSSILASMIASFEKVGRDLDNRVSLNPTKETQILLEGKKTELQDIFRKGTGDTVRWSVDENPTDNPYEYEFEMSIQESPKSYTINFMDIPGEWLKSPEKEKRLIKELDNCQVIIIAIDTPHLMEENGRFHDAFNIPKDISRMVKAIRNQKLQRMFLLVPIKCEKYYHEGRMDEVREAVKRGYSSLLSELEKRNKRRKDEAKHTVAITPILTLGGVVFDAFEKNKQGLIETFAKNPKLGSLVFRPKVAYYKLFEKAPHFAPKFCEQPVVYLLCFILRTAKLAGKTSEEKLEDVLRAIRRSIQAIFEDAKALKGIWANVFTDVKLLESAEKARAYLKSEGDGYEFVHNPL